MAKQATKTTTTEAASNVVPFRAGLNYWDASKGDVTTNSRDFEAHFKTAKGNPTERLLAYLGHQFEISRKVSASIINMVALPEMRAAVERWPSDREDIAKDVLDASSLGKAILAEIEAVPPKPRAADAKKLARLRSRRNYILGNMVKAKQLVGKLSEGEAAGWAFMIENDTPEILVAHTSRRMDISSTTAGAIINATTFIGKTKWDDVMTKPPQTPEPMEIKKTADAIPVFKGLTAAFTKWTTADISPKLSKEFRAELSQVVQFGAELLGVPLTASQKAKLEEASEATGDDDDDTKEPDKDENAAKDKVFRDVDKMRAEKTATKAE